MSNDIFLLEQSPLFPPADLAQENPNGLLAVGGDLSVERLIEAYKSGIFPWFCEGEPILWWSPNPRCVFLLDGVHVSRSMKRELNKSTYTITINKSFGAVVDGCAAPRAKEPETWILPEMKSAYQELHSQGFAHSIEVWKDDELVGGLYGVSLGRFFFGESMFSRAKNASKFALIYLTNYLLKNDFILLDSQVGNPHLYSMGAVDITRENFLELLAKHSDWQQPDDLWQPKQLLDWR
ncbi:MAG: leucyl/phenylalanyl-tRNA--protein transferase [Rickettsiales bacterium]|jgi:leucyl/phenylalanyl-tRNA--protein transferase|nr:leucyl/phenylalanyl-tRNA--protein transferase [Rickettsiales bacterium]